MPARESSDSVRHGAHRSALASHRSRGRRRRRALVGLSLLVLLLAAASLLIGPADVSAGEIIGLMLGRRTARTAFVRRIIVGLRLPRVLVAALTGACLACAGTCTQAVFRNPLASPSVLGVASGAALGAAGAFVLLGPVAPSTAGLVVAALAGGTGVAAVMWSIAMTPVGASRTGLVLAGMAVSALCSALVSVLLYVGTYDQVQQISFWLMGKFTRADWWSVCVVAAAAVAIVPAFMMSRRMDILCFGTRTATDLGVPVRRSLLLILVTATVLTSVPVSVSGTIAFVGLMAPHAARALVGPSHRYCIPMAALTGAVLLLAADTLVRSLVQPVELPVGILSSALGATFFLTLLLRGSAVRGWER